MLKNIKCIPYHKHAKHLFLLTPLALIACGGASNGGVDEPTNTGNANKPVHPVTLNDTGITFFIDDTLQLIINESNKEKPQANKLLASPLNFPGQDANTGRDLSFPDPNNGIDGFDFVKLDKDLGDALPDNSIEFGCVRDNTTQLVWENKTPPNKNSLSEYFKLHDGNAKHTWFNDDPNTNGSNSGQKATSGVCSAEVIVHDTQSFLNAVNAEKLCGFDDWRLPTTEELRSLVNYSIVNGNSFNPMVDTNYFPNIALTLHRWTSQTIASTPERAIGFHFHDANAQPHTKSCTPGEESNFGNGTVAVRDNF